MKKLRYIFKVNSGLLVLVLMLTCFFANAQNKPILVDEVVAVIGKNAIFKSDIDAAVTQLQMQGAPADFSTSCYVLQERLFEKLLVHKAEVDSVDVSDQEIDDAINRRMEYMLMRLGGSDEEFLKYYGKSVLQFKKEIRGTVADNILGQKVKNKIIGGLTISPTEVKSYFNSIPLDSLPVVPESYKIAQLVVKAKPNSYEKERVKSKLIEIRNRIVNGTDFGLMAGIHSDDPGSRQRDGDLGFLSRNQLVPEFSAVAFKLQPGEISDVVESPFGFHLIQVLEKKGNLIHARHILKSPSIYESDLDKARERADSISKVIKSGVDFNKLASDLSDDEQSKVNGGIVRNQQTGGDYFEVEELDQNLYIKLQGMTKGDITQPELFNMLDNSRAYRIVYLMDKLNFHVANIESDYDRIKSAALAKKQEDELMKWINSHLHGTYIKLPESYKECSELSVWFSNETKPISQK